MRARTRLAVAALVVAMAACDGSPDAPAPVCTISIAPASLAFGAEGGTGAVTVTAPGGCAWNATAGAAWITVTGGASGSGPGTVAYSLAANMTTEVRNGALTISGQTHAVSQQGRPPVTCAYELSPGGAEFDADNRSGTFAVTTLDECSWSAVSNAGWLLITSGAQGNGRGTVAYEVTRNTDIADRSAAITVGDRTFTVRQAGDVNRCEYSVAPVDLAPCMPAGTVVATVTTQASCPWTAASNASWITLPGGGSGSGSAVITITYSDNYDAPRDGVVMVRWPTPTAGQNLRIAQAGCVYAVSRAEFSFPAGAGSGAFDVIQQSIPNACGGATQDRCLWTAQSNVPWITITSSMPRRGDNPVAFSVAANDATQSRTGLITVSDRVVVITQAGR